MLLEINGGTGMLVFVYKYTHIYTHTHIYTLSYINTCMHAYIYENTLKLLSGI